MASAGPKSAKEALQEELACSICLEVLSDPVMIVGCGHNFCRLCLERYWEGALRKVSCPQCRTAFPKARLEENRQLRNVARRMASLSPTERPLCALHQEPLKLFCQDEGSLICVVCDKGKAHRGHRVLPLEEAQQELQDQIAWHLTYLKKTREDAEKFKEEAKKSMKDMEIGIVKDKLLADIEEFCQYLKHQVQLLLPHLDVFQADLTKKVDETSSRYSMKIDQLNSLISDIEKTGNRPAIELLKERARIETMICKGQKMCHQFVRKNNDSIKDLYVSVHSSSSSFAQSFLTPSDLMAQSPAELPSQLPVGRGRSQLLQGQASHFKDTIHPSHPCYSETLKHFEANSLGDLEKRHRRFIEYNKTVQEILVRFKGEMAAALRRARGDVLKPCAKEEDEDYLMLQNRRTDSMTFLEAKITFDAVTAHNQLILSWDGRSVCVKWGSAERKPFHKKQFDHVQCVLGTLAFTEGRHCWEIDIEKTENWGVGVAKESVKRKARVDPVDFSPEDGIWAIGCFRKYVAFTGCINENHLSLCEPLKIIKVCLNYMAGEVSFCNARTNTLIFAFPPATFGGEPIRPWFWLNDGQMSLFWKEYEDAVDRCLAF